MFPTSRSADAEARFLAARGLRVHARAGEFAGRDRAAGEYPAPVLAAAILTAENVSFLLVGSAALWLHREPVAVGDTDAVIEPGEQNLRRLREVLAGMALRPRTSRCCTWSVSPRPTAGSTACWNADGLTGSGCASPR